MSNQIVLITMNIGNEVGKDVSLFLVDELED